MIVAVCKKKLFTSLDKAALLRIDLWYQKTHRTALKSSLFGYSQKHEENASDAHKRGSLVAPLIKVGQGCIILAIPNERKKRRDLS